MTLSPSVIAFSSGAAFIESRRRLGSTTRVFRTPWTAIIVGAIAGVPAGAIGAPVAATSSAADWSAGTGSRRDPPAAGLEMFNATFAQSMVSDIVEALIFALAYVVIRSLPKRIIGRYEFAAHSRPRVTKTGSSGPVKPVESVLPTE